MKRCKGVGLIILTVGWLYALTYLVYVHPEAWWMFPTLLISVVGIVCALVSGIGML
jgi:hypothetical protein